MVEFIAGSREIFPTYLESIKTMAALRARRINDLTNGDAILLVGYLYVGDKLGGTYVWNANSTEEDDGRTVVIPDVSDITARGRWILANEQQQGNKGPDGDKGPTGDKGLPGDKGPTGDRGPAGDVGGDVVGSFKPFAGASAPAGYLICNGSEVSQATYPALFAVIGNTWGAAVTQGNFKLPNLTGRTLIGAGTGYALGSTGGEATHQITLEEMPAHRHGNGMCDEGSAMFSHGYFGSSVTTPDSVDNDGDQGSNEGWTGTRGGGFDGKGSQPEGPGNAMSLMQPYAAITWLIRA